MHNCTIKCSLPPKHSKRTDTSLSLVCCLKNVLIPKLGWILSSTVKHRPTVDSPQAVGTRTQATHGREGVATECCLLLGALEHGHRVV